MLAKNQRLTVAEFDQYFKIGKRFNGQYLQLIFTSSDDFHAAVVVGKKVFKIAVKRNRLRRRIYDFIRANKTKSGIYICLVKPTAKTATYAAIKEDLLQLLIKQVQ